MTQLLWAVAVRSQYLRLGTVGEPRGRGTFAMGLVKISRLRRHVCAIVDCEVCE
jgi:hypothetical protein